MTLACKDIKTKKATTGFKIFQSLGDDKYYYVGFFMSAVELDDLRNKLKTGKLKPYQENKWATDKSECDLMTGFYYFYKPKDTEAYVSYPAGMHVFANKKDAKNWLKGVNKDFFPNLTIKEVDIKKIVATGYTEDYRDNNIHFLPTIVCKKIRIKK